ncbi:MAG: hypothetical protein EOP45_12550 [Sphingobacteriaceae bacterium]|nr:MAG: hypothetical protein EOP45_12550 [Sphingobacteriaceae bacterium]
MEFQSNLILLSVAILLIAFVMMAKEAFLIDSTAKYLVPLSIGIVSLIGAHYTHLNEPVKRGIQTGGVGLILLTASSEWYNLSLKSKTVILGAGLGAVLWGGSKLKLQ